ncbi:MAG: hypothetical protein J0G32_05300 [Alphaproteobacteria bacterium]|nr:hypothetical protein [Alphaproteobacteria bacterium]OJV16007.1 MAG: hypothetical protein BGO27_04075 [Alphaproteobacteria bacterium 33-17]
MIKLFFIMIIFFSPGSFAGKFCASEYFADPKISVNRNAYDCECYDGRAKDFRLDNGQPKLGKCFDNYKYKLDVRLFEDDASVTRPRLWLDATRYNGFEYLMAPIYTSQISSWLDLSPTSGSGVNAATVATGSFPQLSHTDMCRGLMCGLLRPSVFYVNNGGTITRGVGTFGSNLNLDNMTLFIVYRSILLPPTIPTAINPYTIFTLRDNTNAAKLILKQTSTTSLSLVFPDILLSDYSRCTANGSPPPDYVVPCSINTDLTGDPLNYILSSGSGSQDNLKFVVVRIQNKNVEFYVNPYQQSYDTDESPSMQQRQNKNRVNYSGTLANINNYIIAASSNPAANVFGSESYTYLHMHEVILFDRALAHGERREIEMYLRRKWGITISMPTQ